MISLLICDPNRTKLTNHLGKALLMSSLLRGKRRELESESSRIRMKNLFARTPRGANLHQSLAMLFPLRGRRLQGRILHMTCSIEAPTAAVAAAATGPKVEAEVEAAVSPTATAVAAPPVAVGAEALAMSITVQLLLSDLGSRPEIADHPQQNLETDGIGTGTLLLETLAIIGYLGTDAATHQHL
jgi:hypothetical protein